MKQICHKKIKNKETFATSLNDGLSPTDVASGLVPVQSLIIRARL